ncbi:MAG TPA: SHOCT domain-containing protein [Solirubrobacteraceae bacterium]|nr:SHOCT domain-containing protein [Solirubrobacteraceae bacterium]
MSEPERVGVGVRAALHALDAALAEHRRALALAAQRREKERMTRTREVKAAAQTAAATLEQPVERPMRALRLAETWVEVDRVRHPLAAGVRAEVAEGELRVHGNGWVGRVVVAPGDGPAAAAAAAAKRIDASVPLAQGRARARLRRFAAAAEAHAAACLGLASALAAADRDAGERHADGARLDQCVEELAERLGPQALVEPTELAHARDRLAKARGHLANPPAHPYAWLAEWPPEVAGAMLRDLPGERLEPARASLRRLADTAAAGEPLLALAAGTAAVAAVTPSRVLVASADEARAVAPHEIDPQELVGLEEVEPGYLAAVLELVTAAVPALEPEPAQAEAAHPDLARVGARAAGNGPAAAPPPDIVDLLRKLGDLHHAGVLTEDEFAAKKAELLRRI